MIFDGTINLGQIFNILIVVIGGFYFVWEVKGKLALLIQETAMRHAANEEKFKTIDLKLNELVSTTVELAKQELRMNHIDTRIQELSNRLASINGGSKRIARK